MDRTRSRVHDPLAVTCHYGVNAPSPTDAGTIMRQPEEVMRDSTNPGYFKAEREGKLLPNAPMEKFYLNYILSPGNMVVVASRPQPPFPDEKYTMTLSGLASGVHPPEFAILPEYDLDILVQEAKGRAQQRAFDALTFAAELRKSLEMITGVRARAESLYERFIERVKRAIAKARTRGSAPFDLLKLVSEVWLEMRYGWRPIYYEMLAIQEVLERPFLDPNKIYRGYASEKADFVGSQVVESSNVGFPAFNASNTPFRWRTTVTHSYEIEWRGAVGVGLMGGSNIAFDPLVTSWELLPHTVFLGWFVTIQDVLRAWSPFVESSGKFSCGSVRVAEMAQRVVVPYVPDTSWSVVSSMEPGTDIAQRTSYVRIPLQPTPTFAFRLNLDLWKIIDLLAVYGLGNMRLFRKLASAMN